MHPLASSRISQQPYAKCNTPVGANARGEPQAIATQKYQGGSTSLYSDHVLQNTSCVFFSFAFGAHQEKQTVVGNVGSRRYVLIAKSRYYAPVRPSVALPALFHPRGCPPLPQLPDDTETAVELAGRLQMAESVCDADDKGCWRRLLDKVPVSCWCRCQCCGEAGAYDFIGGEIVTEYSEDAVDDCLASQVSPKKKNTTN